jgi:hypothetical protein
MLDKLKLLISKCKCGVNVRVNAHKDNYETVEKYLMFMNDDFIFDEDDALSKADFSKMVEDDTIVEVTFYPDTPIGSYQIFSHDIDTALDRALDILNQGR